MSVPSQQYCLKWNNHPSNISSVFDRLKSSQQFVDVTLAAADRKTIRCHKLLLCAGSGYLEEILSTNPSEHPTIVLSEIDSYELTHLVDFMYSGEVAVEQHKLPKLLHAARILKIKGLWEGQDDEEEEEETEISDVPLTIIGPTSRSSLDSMLEAKMIKMSTPKTPKVLPVIPVGGLTTAENAMKRQQVITGKAPVKAKRSPSEIIGSQKRKKKRLSKENEEIFPLTPTSSLTPPPSLTTLMKNSQPDPNDPKKDNSKQLSSPLFGISNAYFLTQKPDKEDQQVKTNKMSDLPALLAQAPGNFQLPLLPSIPKSESEMSLPLPAFLSHLSTHPQSESATRTSEPDSGRDSLSSKSPNPTIESILAAAGGLLASTPVRRYKQYTEDSLQKALREIMEGQSINRSSMKYNIPARTLRDWMKRLNIKSVFTHNNQSKDGSVRASSDGDDNCSVASSSESSGISKEENGEKMEQRHETKDQDKPEEVKKEVKTEEEVNGDKKEEEKKETKDKEDENMEEDEEEIDDDEEECLKIEEN